MSHASFPATSRRRTREQPGRSADRPATFLPDRNTKAPRPARPPTPSGIKLQARSEALVALRARLRGNVAHAAESALTSCVEATGASPDTADRAGESLQQDLALSLLGNAATVLDRVEAALQRIANGSYGRCARCGAKIPDARLEAVPYAAACVDCAAKEENTHREA